MGGPEVPTDGHLAGQVTQTNPVGGAQQGHRAVTGDARLMVRAGCPEVVGGGHGGSKPFFFKDLMKILGAAGKLVGSVTDSESRDRALL